jgi:hypothetical protein
MRTAWKDRVNRRAAICGPSGENPSVLTNVELSQAKINVRDVLPVLQEKLDTFGN